MKALTLVLLVLTAVAVTGCVHNNCPTCQTAK